MPTSWDSPSGSEVDEFPDLDTLVLRAKKGTPATAQPANKSSIRRRKLAPLADDVLLKPWTVEATPPLDPDTAPSAVHMAKPMGRPETQPRTRKPAPSAMARTLDKGRRKIRSSTVNKAAFDKEASADDSSEFHDTISIGSDDSDDWDVGTRLGSRAPVPSSRTRKEPGRRMGPSRIAASPEADADLAGAIDRLHIGDPRAQTAPTESRSGRSTTPPPPPPSTPPKLPAGLVSPKKLPKMPATPHHPTTDLFWSREFVDDWNDEHSPKKQLFPDAVKSRSRADASPKKKGTAGKTAAEREAKKAFEEAKHGIANSFLSELDQAVTQGRLSELAETTGGIKLSWTNKLNTTAGRASWKRETVRTRNADGTGESVQHRHHASIELAEKVIDSEHRLLNVIAHEFCHLANFMVTGMTNNPHGKEFKAWAAKCSRMFGHRGIDVTTRHSYDIDFKYVWECATCALEYKRHSKSINPDRHRCGSCKGLLQQTRPVPRAGAGKPTEYQKFMKDQMKVLKQEDPKSPQKEIMKRVADRWSTLQASSKVVTSVDEVAVGLEHLDVGAAC